MNGGTLLERILSAAWRWARLVPALLRHDPLFRYAALAAALAVFFLIARVAQEIVGPGAIPPPASGRVGQDAGGPDDRSAADAEPPAPGSAAMPLAPKDGMPPAIVPGRSLEGIEVEPTAPDSFGTLPQGENPE